MFNLLSFTNLLADGATFNPMSLLFVVAIAALFILPMLFNRGKKSKQQEEEINMVRFIKPGHKIITIGGITGIVVEKDDEEDTFVLETGTEKSGKSYLKFYLWAIRDSDAFEEYRKIKEAERLAAIEAQAEAKRAAEKAKEDEKAAKKADKEAKKQAAKDEKEAKKAAKKADKTEE